jgi:hypothetical protein
MSDNMKDFFDKVMNKNQEPESNNNDNQGSTVEWNHDYFVEGLCPNCGFSDQLIIKSIPPDGVVIEQCKCPKCSKRWALRYIDDGIEVLVDPKDFRLPKQD